MRLREVYRVTVFVPPAHLQALHEGILSVEPLGDERYDAVMWLSAPGIEQFRPLAGAHPAQGAVGELARVPSVCLTFAIPRDPERLARVLREGVRRHHPWESPAIFVDESLQPIFDDEG
ncbi:hypothetical protein P6166_08905 [Stenotrophomonas sp. HITSZ_GD]|uniref:hypothetical protein n=1 Tax=Stenotrophomonas sp. HITSZ_GD TaxID=3037248 RepID=UPI00240D9957|nr:hypothetical protein [Stenotrophomonas sp. HITSZ_GD]MDG2525469.1 hypothetical protein [Stenotrophomonas sp. HITSZ_GD]